MGFLWLWEKRSVWIQKLKKPMEPPRGFLASLWSFICFLPYFIGLLILGLIKGQCQILPFFAWLINHCGVKFVSFPIWVCVFVSSIVILSDSAPFLHFYQNLFHNWQFLYSGSVILVLSPQCLLKFCVFVVWNQLMKTCFSISCTEWHISKIWTISHLFLFTTWRELCSGLTASCVVWIICFLFCLTRGRAHGIRVQVKLLNYIYRWHDATNMQTKISVLIVLVGSHKSINEAVVCRRPRESTA